MPDVICISSSDDEPRAKVPRVRSSFKSSPRSSRIRSRRRITAPSDDDDEDHNPNFHPASTPVPLQEPFSSKPPFSPKPNPKPLSNLSPTHSLVATDAATHADTDDDDIQIVSHTIKARPRARVIKPNSSGLQPSSIIPKQEPSTPIAPHTPGPTSITPQTPAAAPSVPVPPPHPATPLHLATPSGPITPAPTPPTHPPKSTIAPSLSATPSTPATLTRRGSARRGRRRQEDDEVGFVQETHAWDPNRDMVHFRYTCSKYPFKRQRYPVKLQYCPNCFCYVCDVLSSACASWDSHCRAYPTDAWSDARQSRLDQRRRRHTDPTLSGTIHARATTPQFIQSVPDDSDSPDDGVSSDSMEGVQWYPTIDHDAVEKATNALSSVNIDAGNFSMNDLARMLDEPIQRTSIRRRDPQPFDMATSSLLDD